MNLSTDIVGGPHVVIFRFLLYCNVNCTLLPETIQYIRALHRIGLVSFHLRISHGQHVYIINEG
jgi:hypothetical protein